MEIAEQEPRVRIFRIIAFLAVGLLFFLRRPSSLLAPQLWAEDAVVFFDQAFHLKLGSFSEAYAGYLHTGPRLVAFVSRAFPAAYAPWIFAWSAFFIALVSMGLLIFSRINGNPWVGSFLSIAAAIAPHTFPEIFWSLTNVQWPLSILLIGLLIADSTKSIIHSSLRSTMIFIAGASTPLSAAFIPFSIWRAVRTEKTTPTLLPFALAILAGLIQGIQILTNHTSTHFTLLSSPVESVQILGMHVFLQAFLPKSLYLHAYETPWLESVTGILGLAAITTMTLRAKRMREPMVMLLGMGAVLFLATLARVDAESSKFLLDANMDGWGDRYFYVLRVLMLAILILRIFESKRYEFWALSVSLCLMIASAFPRLMAPPLEQQEWLKYAPSIDAKEPADIPINPGWTYKFRPRSGISPFSNYELRLEIAADHPGVFQVFYAVDPSRFSEVDSVAKPFEANTRFQSLQFPFSATKQFALRLDPGNLPGALRLRNIELWQNGNRLGGISALALRGLNDIQIDINETSEEILSATVPDHGVDPMLLVPHQAMDQLLR